MSLQPSPLTPVPEETALVARAAFPKGAPLITLRDEIGTVFHDADFADLYPAVGRPAYAPWRLALVTVLQFREGLSDRRAADAVRARIDWKYLLGLSLADPGFDFSVLSEFRTRLLEHGAEQVLLDRVLDACRCRGLLKARGRQRTDSTHVVADIREMNRLELAAESVRAALNVLAAEAPDWTRQLAAPEWYDRYDRRVEDGRLPQSKPARAAYAVTIGMDGYTVLDAVDAPDATGGLSVLPAVEALRRVWSRHYERGEAGVQLRELRGRGPDKGDSVESPYDVDARYRTKSGTTWIGYMVHFTETCGKDAPRLVVHAETTPGDVHEAMRTGTIHEALAAKGLVPSEHLADAAYISADHLVEAHEQHGIRLVGPPRKDPNWQARIEDGYTAGRFDLDWERQTATCPEGTESASWTTYHDAATGDYVSVRFRASDCRACPARARCAPSDKAGRSLRLHPQAQHEALVAMRAEIETEAGRAAYAARAGVEGTLSQAVRAMDVRRSRYHGLDKTRLGHVATAAALSVDRAAAWLGGRPVAQTRTSRFAALAA